MLEIIYGKAGTGKSALLYKKINEEAEKGKKVFLFVPDQFSFEAEKIIYKTVKPPYGMNVTVTMFSRTAQKILQLYGETKAYADDVVKAMLMKRILNNLAAEGRLIYYRRQLKNPTFPRIMLNIIGELRNGGLTPSALRSRISDYGAAFSETLTDKLNDISEIYTEYDALLTASFDDRLDDVRRAAELVCVTDYFDNSVCFFDCFDDFSGSQLEFIKSIMMKAEKTVFALTTDGADSQKQHFRGTSRLIQKLREMESGRTELVQLKEQYRKCESCEIVKARNMWQECDWICSRIHSLIDEGYRCRDIAVLMPDKAYGQILESALEKYDLPAFIDIPEPLINKAVVRFAVYTLQALSFETEDILRYVKSGFVRHKDGKTISNIRIDSLEQLCLKYDIRKRDWLKPFPEKADEDGELEELRKAIINPLKSLKKAVENADGAEITEALCLFLCKEMDIERSMYGLYLEGRDKDGKVIVDKKKQDEYSALWEEVVEIFESAHEALRGSRLSLNEYIEILTDIFSSAEIAKPPQVLDAVTVGDVERSRFNKVKAVFICGVNQGIFPRPASTSGNFTGNETEQLASCGITIGGDRIARSSAELFKLYRCTNLPEERLFITYPLLSNQFTELSPSPYIENIKARFSAEIIGADDYGADFYCRTEKAARRYLAGIYSDYSKQNEKNAVLKALDESGYENLLEAAFRGTGDRHIISRENAERLLLKPSYSPTALEKINNCKFSYFCSDGLNLRDNLKREVGARLSGNVVHYCLERLLTDYIGKAEEFNALTEKDITEHVEGSIKEYLENELLEGFGAAQRFSYQVKRLSELAVPAAISVRNNIINGSFMPAELERELSFKFGDITIKGICDRFDISTEKGGKYLRIVDYKRGKNNVPLDGVYRGENLQMFLYLFGLCEELGAKPSSVLYQPVGSYEKATAKSVDLDHEEALNAQKNADSHKANGIMIEGSPEAEEAENINSYYTEIYGKKRGGYSMPQIISEKSFASMKEYCKAYVNAVVMEAANGMVSACPKNEDKCKYCPYGLFCGHEPKEEEDELD